MLKELRVQFENDPWPDVFVPFWADPNKIEKEIKLIIEKAKQTNGQNICAKNSLFYNFKIFTPHQKNLVEKYILNLYNISVKIFIQAKYPSLAKFIQPEIQHVNNGVEINLMLEIPL